MLIQKRGTSLLILLLFLFIVVVVAVIAPRPIDQEPNEANFIGVVIVVLTAIIVLLVAVILFIVSRTKRARGSNVLDAFQYSFNPNTLGGNVDKHRPNGNSIKVSIHTHIHIDIYYIYVWQSFEPDKFPTQISHNGSM